MIELPLPASGAEAARNRVSLGLIQRSSRNPIFGWDYQIIVLPLAFAFGACIPSALCSLP